MPLSNKETPEHAWLERVAKGAQVCACGNVRRASRVLTQFYDEALRESNLRISQFHLLARLTIHEPITISQLAEKLVMDRTTLTRDLKVLQEKGWAKSVAGVDQRTRLLTITPQGYAKFKEAVPLWEKAQAQVTNGLGSERFQSLLVHLKEVVAATT